MAFLSLSITGALRRENTMSTLQRRVNAGAKQLPPVKVASDCWDWLSAEAVIRHALAAYYAACRRHERFAEVDGSTRSIDRTTLTGDLHDLFALRLQADAYERGVCEHYHRAKARLDELVAMGKPSPLKKGGGDDLPV